MLPAFFLLEGELSELSTPGVVVSQSCSRETGTPGVVVSFIGCFHSTFCLESQDHSIYSTIVLLLDAIDYTIEWLLFVYAIHTSSHIFV